MRAKQLLSVFSLFLAPSTGSDRAVFIEEIRSYFKDPSVDVVPTAARGFSQRLVFSLETAVSDVKDAIRLARRKEGHF